MAVCAVESIEFCIIFGYASFRASPSSLFAIEQMIKRAQRAEHLKELGILDSSMNSLSSGTNSSALYYGTGLGSKGTAGALPMHSASVSTTAPSKEDDEDVRIMFSFTVACFYFAIVPSRYRLKQRHLVACFLI